jgi:type VI secretion system protein
MCRWPLFALLVLGACTSAGPAEPGIAELAFQVAPDANDNTPVAVDLVLVDDKRLLDQLLTLTAREWFEQREQIRRDHPRDIELLGWELVPGQELPPQPVRAGRRSVAAIIYANYLAPGAHRWRLGGERRVLVHLGPRAFDIVP